MLDHSPKKIRQNRNYCGRRDSNPRSAKHWSLNPARLTTPARPHKKRIGEGLKICSAEKEIMQPSDLAHYVPRLQKIRDELETTASPSAARGTLLQAIIDLSPLTHDMPPELKRMYIEAFNDIQLASRLLFTDKLAEANAALGRGIQGLTIIVQKLQKANQKPKQAFRWSSIFAPWRWFS
jgi:hypothetical protein